MHSPDLNVAIPDHHSRPRVFAVLAGSVLFAGVIILVVPFPVSASDTATRWESFSESSNCGAPYTRGPFASKSGSLSTGETILGPYGTYFGRSITEVRSHLVYWTVPASGGRRVRVHEEMLPSLQRVTANLNAHAAQGRVYNVTSVGSFVSRTVGGSHQISRHALGLAIDINPAQNPFREDGRLITNMPSWFVDSWTSEGFCWGGDWTSTKDPMHFSWMGPAATPSTSDTIVPNPPKTAKTGFGGAVATYNTEFAPVMSRYHLGVFDASGNGAPDVAGLRAHPGGSVLDVASSTFGYGRCSVFRWFIDDENVNAADHVVFGDIDGDSGQDLVALTASGGNLVATVATRNEGFGDIDTHATGLESGAVAVALADFDGDHLADLWEATQDGRLRVWRGPGFTQTLADSQLPAGAPLRIDAGDRDGSNRPELFALYGGGRVDVLTFNTGWALETSINVGVDSAQIADIGAVDYDGDGRADLQVLDSSGRLRAHVGNSSTGIPSNRWFLNPDWECEVEHPLTLSFDGSFYDDDGSIFEANIESIAATSVTRGCNPPFRDRFCPGEVVTRETMAAFLVRALGLTDIDHPGFKDVAVGSTFAQDIAKLATAGITKGCNPPANDRFCPGDPVTRETMAAFLVRGLQLTDGNHPGFRDVPTSSIFTADIKRLAKAGITRGCDPPVNTEFCPKDAVTRETMAAFLDRAGLGA